MQPITPKPGIQKNRLIVRRTAVTTIIALIAIVGGAYYYLGHTVKPISESWAAISWRAQIYLKKAYGTVPELSWTELLKMTLQQGRLCFEKRDCPGPKRGSSPL